MNSNWVFIAYYIYAVLLILGTGYVVFGLGYSGWWFLLTLCLMNISPTTKKDE